MKTVQDCSHWREAIRAWVGEGAAGEQAARIQSHLAACADCRRYAGELRAAAAGLRWLADRPVDYREVRFFAILVSWEPAGPAVQVIEDAF